MENDNLMQNMIAAASMLKGSKFKNLSEIEPFIKKIMSKALLATREETMALVAMFDRQCSNKQSNLNDLSDYFQCSSMEIMTLSPAIKSLLSKGYIQTENTKERELTKMAFKVCPEIFNAIVEGVEICPNIPSNTTQIDQFIFCNAVHEMIDERKDNHISTKKLFAMVEQYENEHSEVAMISELKSQIVDIAARVWFYEMCRDFSKNFNGGKTGLDRTLRDIYDSIVEGVIIKKKFIDDSHILIENELISSVIEEDPRDEPLFILCLREKGIRLLLREVADAFIENCYCADKYEFLNKIDNFVSEYKYNFRAYFSKIENFEQGNKKITVIANIIKLINDLSDRILYYCICKEMIDGNSFYIRNISNVYKHYSRKAMFVKQQLKEKRHILQKHGLIEIVNGHFFESAEIVLTDKGKKLFLEEDMELFEETVDDKDLIDSAKIAEKRLFFEPSLEKQLATLKKSLEDSNFTTMRERLKANNLPTGIAVLLYGLPGTGKTESVMQIARATGRSVMHVDISATKTCWFGESEKLIKEVFTTYRKLCEKSKVKPILLFNEADAVFSKRKDSNSSSVAQTENAIQNIILEEIENLDGILIATTNLAANLDKAFERRFLFKIYFDKPTTESKICIWKDKMPSLTNDEAMQLATTFDFSGGEIDNIVRKVTMEEVIGGNQPDMVRMMTICGEERIATANRKIGF